MSERILCCNTCLWFNGEAGDGTQFCDEKETYVSENDCCVKYREKTLRALQGNICIKRISRIGD